jgi:hypothetical protein
LGYSCTQTQHRRRCPQRSRTPHASRRCSPCSTPSRCPCCTTPSTVRSRIEAVRALAPPCAALRRPGQRGLLGRRVGKQRFRAIIEYKEEVCLSSVRLLPQNADLHAQALTGLSSSSTSSAPSGPSSTPSIPPQRTGDRPPASWPSPGGPSAPPQPAISGNAYNYYAAALGYALDSAVDSDDPESDPARRPIRASPSTRPRVEGPPCTPALAAARRGAAHRTPCPPARGTAGVAGRWLALALASAGGCQACRPSSCASTSMPSPPPAQVGGPPRMPAPLCHVEALLVARLVPPHEDEPIRLDFTHADVHMCPIATRRRRLKTCAPAMMML